MGLILTVLSAALLTAANYYGELYFLSWAALLPFLYYLFVLKNDEITYRKIFLNGWNLGFWILIFSANFLYHSIKLYTSAPMLIIILILVLLFSLLSLSYGLFFLFYFYLQSRLFSQNQFRPFLFAFCWALFEFSRHYLLHFFPIASPAYTQAEFVSFIQLAELGGIWLLTFVLILVNGLLFQLFFQKKFKNIFIIALIFIIIFSFAYSRQQTNFAAEGAKEIEIGIITTEIDQKRKWSSAQLDQNIALVLKAASELNQTQLIIAPETNLTFDFHSNQYYRRQFLNKAADKFETPIQIGSLAAGDSARGRYNSSFLVSESGEIAARYDKNLLLYFGETYPYQKILNKYTPYNFSSLKAGEDSKVFKNKNLSWKTVICSEILYPEYVQTESDIDFIVNQTNEAWFNESRLLKNIMWQAAVLRAVENRVPVIKTGNQAHSGIIYPSGEYQKVNPSQNYHILKFK
ncbi:apolipoprotein N-acyltransferase [Halanaerobium saccharolyticum]|uniref:Apolipoprotein N-acyltransferase n=1 Tax=Halanaerobium saccharolyticum TaxID=43595 RepID=A0A4R6LUB0_9FIRM|nr:apolipoprotein N-acyltransferase [Halanaerobium saccharolyticum]TDO91281.1 apolipoprotein N-acyltransferase [Halanaerobium saccharolyticum]